MLDLYLPLFIAASLQFQRPITVSAQHSGNTSSIFLTMTRKNDLHLPVGARVTEFRHPPVTSRTQLPKDVPIKKHVRVCIRGPNIDKRKLSKESKNALHWILDSLLPLLLSTIPLNRSCHLNIQAAANAFAADDTMGIGGWATIQSSTFGFSETWTRQVFIPFLVVHKDLQRYTSWEALAQICIILIVHQKCEPRPGLINIQPARIRQYRRGS